MRVLSRSLEALLAQLPQAPLARAGAIVSLLVGGVVALLVPIFFAIMLWGALAGP